MSGTTRKQAPRLARPAAIYRPGRAPKVEEEGDVLIGGDQDIVQEDEGEEEETMPMRKAPVAKLKAMNVALKDVNISKEGKVIVAGKDESGRTAAEEEEEEEDSEEESDGEEAAPGGQEEETDSSEYESDSEEEEKPKLQFRPVFVPKRNRATVAEREAMADDTEEAQKRRELEAEERKKQSHDLVAESIRRELAEKEKEDDAPDVDDTDGLDPEAEFEAWRLRELARIKREKEDEVRRDQEREEVERRRALPEAQRLKEDMEHAKQSRDSKPKGSQKFLQKYWHKGAFHQDEEVLKRHDFTEATESTVDVSVLPQVMQVKNFGKRSRTKYTHLVDQDTTIGSGGFGGAGTIKVGSKTVEGGQGCFLCGGPHMKKDLQTVLKTPVQSCEIDKGIEMGNGDRGKTETIKTEGGLNVGIEIGTTVLLAGTGGIAHVREIGNTDGEEAIHGHDPHRLDTGTLIARMTEGILATGRDHQNEMGSGEGSRYEIHETKYMVLHPFHYICTYTGLNSRGLLVQNVVGCPYYSPLGVSRQAEDLDLILNWIEHEFRVIIGMVVRSQSGSTVVSSASNNRAHSVAIGSKAMYLAIQLPHWLQFL
ncbi:hypothetical protein AAF712_007289 [Marasmius tenuissimus]|uniref:Micro-fibrillar-associated protein 1 C-terminal domain-containing protein n=1 Tax=Marasmius tenuissimus TaxID=585030 RepID=A0ABR2ZW60_9AGAR